MPDELQPHSRRLAQRQVPILMYHAVVRKPLEVHHWCFLDAATFREQMEILKERFLVVPLSEAVDRLESGRMDEPAAAITIDDGFQNNYEVAFPILRELGLPATVFLTTGLVDTDDTLWFCRLHRALMATTRTRLEWDGDRFCLAGSEDRARASSSIQTRLKELPQPRLLKEVYRIIRALDQDPEEPIEAGSPFRMLNQQSIAEMSSSGLIEFGAHGVSHAILSKLSGEQRHAEIAESLSSVQELTGQRCRYFAYPNGRALDYGQDSILLLKRLGVRAALTCVSGPNFAATPLLQLRRYGIGAGAMSMAEFERIGRVPELTVSMPAYNTERFIRQAIESVLSQKGVELELIVVDDASQDDTAAVAESFADPRLRLIRNERRMGIAHCHNRVIEESCAPFIAHVDSDDLILPGALRKMIDKIETSPRIGQTHCHFFDINQEGGITREAFRGRRASFLGSRRPGMDYKRELLVNGSVMNALRVYRREVFEAVGGFDARLAWGEDREMALRIVDKYEIALVPEFLYCRRLHSGNTWESVRCKRLRSWGQRYVNALRLLHSGQVRFLREREYRLHRLMAVALYNALGLPEMLLSIRRCLSLPRRAMGFAAGLVRVHLGMRLYDLAVEYLAWWPLDWVPPGKGMVPAAGGRVGYYLWHFPTLSQTFIRREVAALLRSGLDIQVFADAAEDLDLLGEEATSLLDVTHYLLPEDEELFLQHRSHFRASCPLRYLNLFLYVVFHRYAHYKSFAEDFSVFRQAINLAGAMKDRGVSHIHAPWADRCAFVAMIASRLAGVSYSVQARAHDLHRKPHACALREKFENATFVVTNSRYNGRHIQSLLGESNRVELHVVYEGLDLPRFQSPRREGTLSQPVRILSVARLIEEKGLEYLLRAFKILLERGYLLECRIIGGPEEPAYATYHVELKKLHRKLGLADNVFFLGAQPFSQVLQAYVRSDIFVLPCVTARNGGRDITPNSLIEAMAMKLPVISTVQTAIPEIVDDGVNGILVPPNDERALAEAIAGLVEDGALRRELGENARRKVEERFDINRNIQRYVALFSGDASTGNPEGEHRCLERDR